MSFSGQFTFTNAVKTNTSITLNPRENPDFAKACAFASRVELVSAKAEFTCLANGTMDGRISAGFIHADVTISDEVIRMSPDAVVVGTAKDAPIERIILFTSGAFFGKELKGAILGHQPPKFCVYPSGSPGKQTDANALVLFARLTIVVRLFGDGTDGAST